MDSTALPSTTPSISYHTYTAGKNANCVSTRDFRSLLQHCALGERRPIDDIACLDGMILNSNLIVSAWHTTEGSRKLIGIARAVTDFHYACYLSDLAVDNAFQNQGIGKRLMQRLTQAVASTCKIILIAAPAANDYYAPLGFEHNERCWVLNLD
ncbi:MAG TPA: GNAT family N-acetyltransferase [Marinagarivorans sp.]